MASQFAVDLVLKTQGLGKLKGLTGETNKFQTAAKKAQGSSDKLGRALGGVGAKAGQAANGITKTGRAAAGASKGVNKLAGAIKGLIGIYAVVQATKFVFVSTAELETQTRSLKVLTGSMETARDVVRELQAFGNVTPFTSSELIDTAKRLKAFGVDTQKLVDTTKRLGDVAGATGADLSGIATAYGQIMAKGRLQGEELLQLQERGIALQPELQAMYKLSGDEFRKALEKGQISAEAVELALERLTATGGTYANGAIAQSDTLNGRLSTLQDNIQRMAQNIGRILKPLFEWVINQSIRAIEAINGMLGQWKKEDAIGRDRKHELQRQAAADAESKYGRFNLSKEKEQYRNSQYQTYLSNEAAKKGVGVTASSKVATPKIDPLTLDIPDLLGQTGPKDRGTGTRQAAASKQLMGKVVELLTGDKSSQFYAADHGGQNYHVHVAFENQQQKELAKALLQSKGIQIGSENDGKHAPGSYHYSDQAFDVPMSQVPVGQEDAFSKEILGILGKEFGGLLGGTGGGGNVIGQLFADARVELDRLRESAVQTWQQMQQGILGTNTNLQAQVTDLNEVNRLIMEGMDPSVAETQISNQRALLDIDTERLSKLAELNELQGLSADELKDKEAEINALYKERLGLQKGLNNGRQAAKQLATTEASNSRAQSTASGLASTLAGGLKNALITAVQGGDVGAAFQELGAAMGEKFLDIAFSQLEAAFEQMFTGMLGGLDQNTMAQQQIVAQEAQAIQQFGLFVQQFQAAVSAMSATGMGGGGGGFNLGGLAGLFTPGGSLGGFGSGGFSSILGNSLGSFGGGFFPGFADGGYVSGPTTAVIGEGGEPEYVIPASKMGSAMGRYSMGQRGGSVVPGGAGGSEATAAGGGDGTFKLETVVINNQEYATIEQVRAMGQSSAKQGAASGKAQTLGTLRNSRSQRSKLGLR